MALRATILLLFLLLVETEAGKTTISWHFVTHFDDNIIGLLFVWCNNARMLLDTKILLRRKASFTFKMSTLGYRSVLLSAHFIAI